MGWLAQMEATGYVFRDDRGEPRDCLEILREHGIDSIRLRVWVNPSAHPVNGHNSPAEVVAMARRAANAGFRIMIDFHYSDSWADPGKQVKPAAWQGHSFARLRADVRDHTRTVMRALVRAGVRPEWVQTGNEINPGMLLPDGSASDFHKLAALVNAGYAAVKEASPATKVVVHLANGGDNASFRAFFDGLAAAGAKYDVIGMSYYPYWNGCDYTESIAALEANLLDMAARYGKDVVVAEIGGEDTKAANTGDMIRAVMDRVNAVPGGRGIGVFYWEPEGARSWSGYALSAWGDDGRPTSALDAFLWTPQASGFARSCVSD